MACSSDFIAIPLDSGGGSTLGIIHIKDVVRNPHVIKFKGHSAAIQDIDFSPFYSSLVLSASEDNTMRLWDIPPELTEIDEVKSSVVVLSEHTKKVLFCMFNPRVDFLVASGSFDSTVKIWDMNMTESKFSIKLDDSPTSMAWNINGSNLACVTRSKDLCIFDPRQEKIGSTIKCHDGSKSIKLSWIDGNGGNEGYLITTGFSKTQSREIKLWDTKNLSASLSTIDLDRSSQPLYPYYDEVTGMLYIAGKGDGNVRAFQYNSGAFHRVGEYRSNVPTKYFSFIPKVICDTMKCEIGRMLKCENSKNIIPISFTVPRKSSNVFQEDLYPPIPILEAHTTLDDWLNGEDPVVTRGPHLEVIASLKTTQIQPTGKIQRKGTNVIDSRAVQRKKTMKISQDLDKVQIELDEALEEIERLEKENAELKKTIEEYKRNERSSQTSPLKSPSSPPKELDNELLSEFQEMKKFYLEIAKKNEDLK